MRGKESRNELLLLNNLNRWQTRWTVAIVERADPVARRRRETSSCDEIHPVGTAWRLDAGVSHCRPSQRKELLLDRFDVREAHVAALQLKRRQRAVGVVGRDVLSVLERM